MAATLFVNTWSGATATTAVQLISAIKWNYLRVTNASSTAASWLYITTDGVVNVTGLLLTGNTVPATGSDGGWTLAPGETMIVPTKQPIWYQGFGGPGGNINGVGLNNYRNYDPPQSVYTPVATNNLTNAPNPGVGITLVQALTGGTAIVEGAG